jgi:hypothetical protein
MWSANPPYRSAMRLSTFVSHPGAFRFRLEAEDIDSKW